MVAAIGEQREDLDGAIVRGGGCVLDRHRCDRRFAQSCAKIVRVARRVADFQQRHGRDACVAAGTPSLPCEQATPIVKIGPMYVPGRTACFACEETELRAQAPLYARREVGYSSGSAGVAAVTLLESPYVMPYTVGHA
jgi:hypothetical protein